MIYLIDHQDSFTFNLAHLLADFDEVYVSNYFEINKKKLHQSSMVVFSPGPGEKTIIDDCCNLFLFISK